MFHRLQRSIYEALAVLHSSTVTSPGVCINKIPPINLKNFCDCLKLLLDCVPSSFTVSSDFTALLLPADQFIEGPVASSASLLPALQSQLEEVQEQMHRIRSISDVHDQFFSMHCLPKESFKAGEDIHDVVEQWREFCCESRKTVIQLREKSFQTNIRYYIEFCEKD